MALLTRPEVSIRWVFSYDTQQGKFNDALYFTPTEYQALTVGEILTMQQERRDAWLEALRLARVNARAATKAELQAERQARADQLAIEQAQLAELDATIQARP